MENEWVRTLCDALYLVLLLSGPPIAAALVTGLLVSLFQAATQIQEQTLTFVPKLLAVAGVLAGLSWWMLRHLVQWTTELWARIPLLDR